MIIRVLVSLTLISSVYAQVRFNGSGQAQCKSEIQNQKYNFVKMFVKLKWDHHSLAGMSTNFDELFAFMKFWYFLPNSCPKRVAIFFFSVCSTVSGPNPNQKCVLPFKHDGVTYTRCPVDPQDDSKHWCSTRVDRNGVHVPNVRQWGHCGPNCPLERRPKQSVSQLILLSTQIRIQHAQFCKHKQINCSFWDFSISVEQSKSKNWRQKEVFYCKWTQSWITLCFSIPLQK